MTDSVITTGSMAGILFVYSLIIVYVLYSLEERVGRRIKREVDQLQERITRGDNYLFRNYLELRRALRGPTVGIDDYIQAMEELKGKQETANQELIKKDTEEDA